MSEEQVKAIWAAYRLVLSWPSKDQREAKSKEAVPVGKVDKSSERATRLH